MSIVLKAAALAKEAHDGQKRKYTGRPYIEHPMRVAGRVTLAGGSEEMIAAAWLHDVLEDTNYQPWQIRVVGGDVLLQMVHQLTNPSKGSKLSREQRKAMDRQQLKYASKEVKVIKMLDRLDNLTEMDGSDQGFRKLYAHESRLLLDVVGNADPNIAQDLEVEIERQERLAA